MTTFAGFRNDQIVFTGAMPNRFSSDDGVTRSFCGQCGLSVAYQQSDLPDDTHSNLGLFDDLEPLVPIDHNLLHEKTSGLHADEHLPENDWRRPADR